MPGSSSKITPEKKKKPGRKKEKDVDEEKEKLDSSIDPNDPAE